MYNQIVVVVVVFAQVSTHWLRDLAVRRRHNQCIGEGYYCFEVHAVCVLHCKRGTKCSHVYGKFDICECNSICIQGL